MNRSLHTNSNLQVTQWAVDQWKFSGSKKLPTLSSLDNSNREFLTICLFFYAGEQSVSGTEYWIRDLIMIKNIYIVLVGVQSVLLVSSKSKAFTKLKSGNFPLVLPDGKMLQFPMDIQVNIQRFLTNMSARCVQVMS